MISESDYIFITESLGLLYTLGQKSVTLTNNVTGILSTMSQGISNNITENISLATVSTVNAINSQLVNVNYPLASFVYSFQNYIIKDFGSVNGPCSYYGIMVGNDFANLSALLGFIISPQYINPLSPFCIYTGASSSSNTTTSILFSQLSDSEFYLLTDFEFYELGD